MRRALLLVTVLSFLSLPLCARQVGYFAAYDGEKTASDSYGGVSIGFVWEPWERSSFNPSFLLESSFGFDQDSHLKAPSTSLVCNVDLFRTLNHPFPYIAHNRIAYDPSVGAGVQIRYDDPVRVALYLTASPFKFSQPDFWYEALSPFFTYSSKGWSWGVALFRFTYLFL